MISVATCPSAGLGSFVALGYLMSLFRMVCQSALTVQCLSNGGEKGGVQRITTIKSKIMCSLCGASRGSLYKDVAFVEAAGRRILDLYQGL